MILNNSYHEIMDRIEVTAPMHNRIMENLLKETADMEKHSTKIIRFSGWQKYVAIVACFAVLVLCGTVVQNILYRNPDVSQENVAGPMADIVECDSVQELSDKAGFQIKEPDCLPFDVKTVSYTWEWNELAQIDYTGENNALMYRKAVGDEDISGIYTEYTNVKSQDMDGCIVTIKGTDSLCYLATWQYDGYSQAVYVENGISYNDMNTILTSLIP